MGEEDKVRIVFEIDGVGVVEGDVVSTDTGAEMLALLGNLLDMDEEQALNYLQDFNTTIEIEDMEEQLELLKQERITLRHERLIQSEAEFKPELDFDADEEGQY